MTRQSPAEQAEWEAAREVVASYHQQELARLIDRLRAALVRLDAGEIDVFEFDDVVHQYKKGSQKLWSFCVGGGSHIRTTARTIEFQREEGEAVDWWELAAPRRR